MSYRIKGCGCDCATMPADPCQPCNAGAFQIQCRSRTGTATLCGYGEFTTPSVPPKKYKIITLSGASRQISHDADGCGGSVIGVLEYVYTGSCQYEPASSCALVENGSWKQLFNGSVISSGSTCHINTFVCPALPVLSRTQKSFTPNPPCAGGGGNSNECVVSATETLSGEDTEEAAMSRVSPTWTAWGEGGCCTGKELRGPGVFSFDFTEAQYRIRVAGTPGEPINIEITFSRTDGAPYTETRQFVPTSVSFPENSEEGWQAFSITASAGKQTCLSGARIYTGQ